jgi:flagellar FliL protein
LAFAAEDKKSIPKTEYVDIKPSFVVNFGNSGQTLKFAKVDVSIQVADIADAAKLGNNFPLIRNTIVLLLSKQTDKDMSSSVGQEKIRKEALKQVQQVLKDETGEKIAQDLYFTNFVVQQ